MPDIYIARQPILNARRELCGYELLYRGGPENRARVDDPGRATSEVLLNGILEIGLDNVVGDVPAFINIPQDFLEEEGLIPDFSHAVVLEILEDVDASPGVQARLGELKDQGYTLALDDFLPTPDTRSLLPFADIVKLDIEQIPAARMEGVVNDLRERGLRVLAERVETAEQFEWLKGLGCELFQGFFFSRPFVMPGRRLGTNRATVMQLLARLEDPDADIRDIEELVSTDVSLSYRLLRVVNSAYYGLDAPVESIRHALTLLGMSTIGRWVRLLLLAHLDDKPEALVTRCLERAGFCERIAQHEAGLSPERCFTVGLFSLLDAMLDLPLEEVLDRLPLEADLRAALLDRQGVMGRLLECVIDYEQGDWSAVEALGSCGQHAGQAYLDAVAWARKVQSELK